MPKVMRAKFKLATISHHEGGFANLSFKAVMYGTGAENEIFNKFTPNGELNMGVTNPLVLDGLKPGQEFYVDFTEAVPEVKH